MRKRVFLLAVSCKSGGLCPGGIDKSGFVLYGMTVKLVQYKGMRLILPNRLM